MKKNIIAAALLAGSFIFATAPATFAAEIGSPDAKASDELAAREASIKAIEVALAGTSGSAPELVPLVQDALAKTKAISALRTSFGTQGAISRLKLAATKAAEGDVLSVKAKLEEALELMKK